MTRAERILALPRLQGGGELSAFEIAAAIDVSVAEAVDELFRLIMAGRMHRWPGVASLPALYSLADPMTATPDIFPPPAVTRSRSAPR